MNKKLEHTVNSAVYMYDTEDISAICRNRNITYSNVNLLLFYFLII